MSDQYIVSARKYRPADFHSVVGQQNIAATLKGSISSGRLAHAYLFCGPRGVGKTSCARIFAKTLNCLSPTADHEACGECASCRAIAKGNSFNLTELDAASNNSVDDIRQITEQVNVPPQVGKYRVFIIDEVHMLSPQAFNAFLKTLEEPPSYAVFILATTEKHKVIPTILSRCQIFDFKRITINDIVDHLAYVAEKEGVTADRKALGVIARKADGAMRDALSIFDQTVACCNKNLQYDAVVRNLNVLDYEYFFRLTDCFAKQDAPSALLLYKEVRDNGFDSQFFINSLAQHVRDLMVALDPRTMSLLEVPEDVCARLGEQAKSLPVKWYYAALKLLNDCDINYRTSSNKQLLVELTLIRLSQLIGSDCLPFESSDRKVALRSISDSSLATAASSPATGTPPTSVAPAPSVTAQSPAAPVHNAGAPMHNAAPKPAKATRAPGRPSSFNISQKPGAASASLERMKEPVTDEAFHHAWEEFIIAHPEMKILVSAMRAYVPTRTSETEYQILVEHPAQVQAFEQTMPKLIRFLREHLHNDYLTLKADINPDKEIPKFLPPQEFLRKIVENNPAVGEMLKELDVELC